MTESIAHKTLKIAGSWRARTSCAAAALILLLSCQGLQTATADGDTRTLSLHHIHTDENITITYKRDGRYDEAALKKLNWFLRDWRREEETNMDPHLFDLIWEVTREVDAQKPVEVVCGYRSPQTNALLRRRSGGVARFSQHMLGRAMDFFVPGAPLEDLRIVGLRLQRGGVGYYPTSGSPFVHLDTGSVRHWPRMTREQLVRVFPDGRTVHVPSDGRPLAGYALALADIEKRGNSPSATSLVAAQSAGAVDKPKPNLLASLFGSHKDREEEEDNDEASVSSGQVAPAAGLRRTASVATDVKATSSAPTAARSKQPPTYQIASVPTLAPSAPTTSANLFEPSASDVITTRGNWSGSESAEQKSKAAPPIKTAAIAPGITTPPAPPRQHVAALPPAEPKTTASATPWSAISGDVARDDESVPEDVALAYAAQHDTQQKPPAVRAAPMGSAEPQRPTYAPTYASLNPAGATTVLPKSPLSQPMPQQPAVQHIQPPLQSAIAPVSAKIGDQFDDPWLRALLVAPNIENIVVTSFDTPDFRQLRPMMEKPSVSIKMTFSADRQLGAASDHFSGSAIVFLSTVTYLTRTASLQVQ